MGSSTGAGVGPTAASDDADERGFVFPLFLFITTIASRMSEASEIHNPSSFNFVLLLALALTFIKGSSSCSSVWKVDSEGGTCECSDIVRMLTLSLPSSFDNSMSNI